VQITVSKVMALVFWDNDGKWLVKFIKSGVTIGLEQ